MTSVVYNVLMQLGEWAQSLSSLFNSKADDRRRHIRIQYKLIKKQPLYQDRILFHCASFGELEQVIPLIRKIKEATNSTSIIVSFFSPSGFHNAQEYDEIDAVIYLPVDTPKNMRQFVNEIRPKQVFLVKYEIWLNFLKELRKQQISVYLISGRFYQSQLFFKWYGSIFRNALAGINTICVQDQISLKLLQQFGISSHLTGDTRADRVIERQKRINPELQDLSDWSSEDLVLVLGSIWPEDWRIFQPIINKILQEYKLIVAPHEIENNFINRMIKVLDVKTYKWSDHDRNVMLGSRVIMLDKMGLLADIYRYGSVAYIGGAFKQGLHNIFEPASHGLPVLFGPETTKFGEADDLIGAKAAFKVTDPTELIYALNQLKHEDFRKSAGEVARSYVQHTSGSTEKIFNIWRKQTTT